MIYHGVHAYIDGMNQNQNRDISIINKIYISGKSRYSTHPSAHRNHITSMSHKPYQVYHHRRVQAIFM